MVSTQAPAVSGNPADSITSNNNSGIPALDLLVKEQASLKVKANSCTRERFTINREKLLNSCRAALKSKLGAEAKSRVPEEIDIRLREEVDNFIVSTLKSINILNATNFNKRVVPDFRTDCMFEKVTATGRNELKLQEQHLFCGIAIREAKERLRKLEGEPTPKPDLEQKVKERIGNLEKMQLWIDTNLAEQAKLGIK